MDQEKIGKFIAELRKKNKMTQQELGEKLGVTDKTVSRWETAKYMPDLSLFPLVSKELGVSVNDLMSGQVVDKQEYQETFEKNIVKTISKVDKNNRNWNIGYTVLLTFISLVLLWFIGLIVAENVKWDFKYNSEIMRVVMDEQGLMFEIDKPTQSIDYKTIIYETSEKEKIGIVFITAKENIKTYFERKNSYKNCIDLTACGGSGSRIFYESPNFPNNFQVYYTKKSFKHILNANNKELEKIIEKSNLMYESK